MDGKISKNENIPKAFKVDVFLKLMKTIFMISDTNRDYRVGFEDIFKPRWRDPYEDYDSEEAVDENSIQGFSRHELSSLPSWAQIMIHSLDRDENEKLHWSEVENFVRSFFQFFNSEKKMVNLTQLV